MKLKNSLISIGAAALLIGCGSSSDSNGTVDKKSKVCLDANMNAKCDSGETFESVVTWNKTDKVTTTLSGDVPLAYEGENGYIFTAPAGFGKIYPGTTMQNNERIYNQLIGNKTKADAKAYLMGIFGGEIVEAKKNEVADAIKTAIKANPRANRYDVIAAVMNKVVADTSAIKSISISEEDIKTASVPSLAVVEISENFTLSNDAEIERQKALGWIDAKDKEIIGITAKNGKVVAGSKYHNGLTVIDVATQGRADTPVSIISDHGHHIDSASGASENRMEGVTLNSDASFVYVNIPHKKYNPATADGETVGLYKAKIEADGSIKTVETALSVGNGKRISIDETESVRLNKIVKKFAVASDDSKVALLDSDDNLYLYDGDLKNELAAIETDGLSALAIHGDTIFTVADNNISKLNASDLSKTGVISLEFEADELLVSEDGTKLLAYGDGNIAVITMADDSINASSVAYDADAVALSADGTKLALAGEHEEYVLLLNLTVPGFNVQGKYQASSEAVSFIGNDKLAIGTSAGVSVLDIVTSTKNNNLSTKIETAKDGLSTNVMNSGHYFNTVVKDMNLPSAYENIGITWVESGLSSNINLADGAVTRPEGADVSGKLKASLKGSFRGKEVTGTKDIAVTVKKVVPTVAVTSTIELTNDFRGGYMSAGANGKVASLNKEGSKGGIYILESDATSLNFFVGDNNDSDGKKYHEFGGEEDGIAVGYTKDNQVVAVTTLGNIYRYTVNAKDDMTESQKIVQAEGISTKSAIFNASKTKLALLTYNASDEFTTKIYDISADGTVVFSNDIAMEKLTYNGEIAMTEDASIIYTRSEGDVLNAQNGTAHTSHVIGERIRGIYYVNNTLYSASSTGKLTAFADGDLSTSGTVSDTAHNGRTYMIKEVGEKLYIFLYTKNIVDGGVSIVNKETLEELNFIPSKTAYRGAVSADGKSVYFFSFTKPRTLNYTKLP